MTKTSARYSPEVRTRAVRMVLDHQADHPSQCAAIQSIAMKIGCAGETLRKWVQREERDTGQRLGPTSDELARLKAQERENRELRQVNEILRKASAYFAQAELDRPLRK
jgi:transposase-like protein